MFDVAADDVGDIGVLFFLFLDEGVVVVERLVHLDLFLLDSRFLLDPRFRGRRLLGDALRLGIGLFERDGLDLLRLECGSLFRNWRARCDRAGCRTDRVATTTSYTAAHLGQRIGTLFKS